MQFKVSLLLACSSSILTWNYLSTFKDEIVSIVGARFHLVLFMPIVISVLIFRLPRFAEENDTTQQFKIIVSIAHVLLNFGLQLFFDKG